jgi:hypothetical protein
MLVPPAYLGPASAIIIMIRIVFSFSFGFENPPAEPEWEAITAIFWLCSATVRVAQILVKWQTSYPGNVF